MSEFNDRLIADFRAHAGQVTDGPFKGRRLLLLTTRGKRTGKERTTPLAYHRDGERYVVAGSKGGAPTHPDWYRNLLADPNVTVEVSGERFPAHATSARGLERRRLYDQHAALMPGFKEYEKKTTRVIPAIVLERVS